MHQIVRLDGFTVIVLKNGVETNGQFSLCEIGISPNTAFSWLHQHRECDQTVVGVEGITRWISGPEQGVIGPGERLVIPRGTTHGFYNSLPYAARFLCIYTPAVITSSYWDGLERAMQLTGNERVTAMRETMELCQTTLVRP